ncbi:hypothetical protein [Noviherbaspirillum soli]|nr:hypothetical protein [Noviherbaspirillum soli]
MTEKSGNALRKTLAGNEKARKQKKDDSAASWKSGFFDTGLSG